MQEKDGFTSTQRVIYVADYLHDRQTQKSCLTMEEFENGVMAIPFEKFLGEILLAI